MDTTEIDPVNKLPDEDEDHDVDADSTEGSDEVILSELSLKLKNPFKAIDKWQAQRASKKVKGGAGIFGLALDRAGTYGGSLMALLETVVWHLRQFGRQDLPSELETDYKKSFKFVPTFGNTVYKESATLKFSLTEPKVYTSDMMHSKANLLLQKPLDKLTPEERSSGYLVVPGLTLRLFWMAKNTRPLTTSKFIVVNDQSGAAVPMPFKLSISGNGNNITVGPLYVDGERMHEFLETDGGAPTIAMVYPLRSAGVEGITITDDTLRALGGAMVLIFDRESLLWILRMEFVPQLAQKTGVAPPLDAPPPLPSPVTSKNRIDSRPTPVTSKMTQVDPNDKWIEYLVNNDFETNVSFATSPFERFLYLSAERNQLDTALMNAADRVGDALTTLSLQRVLLRHLFTNPRRQKVLFRTLDKRLLEANITFTNSLQWTTKDAESEPRALYTVAERAEHTNNALMGLVWLLSAVEFRLRGRYYLGRYFPSATSRVPTVWNMVGVTLLAGSIDVGRFDNSLVLGNETVEDEEEEKSDVTMLNDQKSLWKTLTPLALDTLILKGLGMHKNIDPSQKGALEQIANDISLAMVKGVVNRTAKEAVKPEHLPALYHTLSLVAQGVAIYMLREAYFNEDDITLLITQCSRVTDHLQRFHFITTLVADSRFSVAERSTITQLAALGTPQ